MGKQLRYQEIAQTIKRKIRQGTFEQGQSLPSQKELAEIFSTSVMTVRGALESLAQEGIITTLHGVGTFVAAPAVHAGSIGLQGFQNELDRQKLPITNRVVSRVHDLTDPDLDRLFRSSSGIYSCLARVRLIDGIPVMLQRSYLRSQHRNIVEIYQEEHSLYQTFSKMTGIMVTQGREIMTPVIMASPELELLGLERPEPAFFSRRTSISLDDEVVLYDEAYLPGRYVIMASRKHGRTSMFKYIINRTGTLDTPDNFDDPELWEDLA